MKEDRTPDLLDVLRHADKLPDCPDGLVLGWRNTRFDLMSRGGFQWGWPGQWTEAPDDGRDLTADHPYTACPSSELGGLCLAKTWEGALSGGVSSLACLVVAFDPADVLGQDRHKLRVRRALTLTVIDMEQIRSNLDGANLVGARLDGANLDGADLDGARGDQWTRIPDGWRVNDTGLVVSS